MERILTRIAAALDRAAEALAPFTSGKIEAAMKSGDDPVTQADIAVDTALRSTLPLPGEGWLSEETADDPARLDCDRVWIVDPLDGTREFVEGIPEWCVSIGYAVDGIPVAGGILAPDRGLRILGAVGEGVEVTGGEPVQPARDIRGALILASRSEVKRGEWQPVFSTPVSVRSLGSVALKLAMVGAGMADATWTLQPKHEWDVAGGAAIVRAAGGSVADPDGAEVRFNQASPKLSGFVACRKELAEQVLALIRQLP